MCKAIKVVMSLLVIYFGIAMTCPPVRAGGATITRDYFHNEIHKQSGFTCSYNNTVTNVGEMSVIAFNTPSGDKHVHMLTVVSSSAGARFGIYRDPSIDNDEGTDLTIHNMDENAGKWSIVRTIESVIDVNKASYFDETAAAAANITKTWEIMPLELAAGSGPFAQGGSGGQRAEIILRSNTQYAFILTANTANDDIHNILLLWYEHTR